jgi:valyl-tRNA synthetase
MELAKSFDPHGIESRWYPFWESRGFFAAGFDPARPSFSIQLPPPNVTGTLHMGHAFQQTLMDILTRYHRMKGENVLWQPGTDHAGIATQMVMERQLEAAANRGSRSAARSSRAASGPGRSSRIDDHPADAAAGRVVRLVARVFHDG